VDEVANIHPPFALTVSQPFLVLTHLAHPLAVCPLLRVLHLNLDGSHRGDSVIMNNSLKDARSDDEGEDGDDDDDDDDDSALRKKKRS
jgi:hypothetical protein